MKAGQVVLQSLLDGKIQYRVPLFQRTYSWGEKDWNALWEDVLEIYAMEQPRNHFIGAVVTQPVSDDPPEGVKKYLLIDGQQRLTTLFIMLSCIRREALRTGLHGLAEEILEACLVNKFASQDEEHIKLHPTQRDRQPFRLVITDQEVTDEDQQILNAFKYFSQRISDGDSDENPFDLGKLKSYITDRLDLVSITLESEDSPHRIFESLNNTGMQLGPSDLVRNLIFMSIPAEKDAEEAYKRLWLPMEKATAKRLDDFFWRYLMMNGSLPRRDETFEEVKKRFEERFRDGGAEQAIESLEEYSKFARYFRWLCLLEDERLPSPLLPQIKRLNSWEVEVSYPFLMRSLDWEAEKIIVASDLFNVMKMVESFVVRRAICNVPTNGLRRIFAGMSVRVGCSVRVDPSEFAASSRNYLLDNNWPSDDDFKESFVRFRLYSNARPARARLILESLEDSFDRDGSVAITDDTTIEHVMPQSLTPEWNDMLGVNASDIYSQWLHTPGNLTLTTRNPELSNASFDEKKMLLQASKFSLTDSVLEQDRWDEDAIRARGEMLAEKAIHIWQR